MRQSSPSSQARAAHLKMLRQHSRSTSSEDLVQRRAQRSDKKPDVMPGGFFTQMFLGFVIIGSRLFVGQGRKEEK